MAMDWLDFLLFALLAGCAFAIFFFMFAFLYIYFAVEMDEEDERKMMRDLNEALSRMADKSGGIIMAAALCLSLCSCASRHTSMPAVLTIKDSVRIERIVPHPIEPKQSSIEAWIECDQRGRTLLTKIRELEDERLSLTMSLDSVGRLNVTARTPSDTVWMRADSVVITKETQVPYPVERQLTKWQQTRMRLGDVSMTAIILGILYVVLWLIKRRSR